jgi:hypothetical protein
MLSCFYAGTCPVEAGSDGGSGFRSERDSSLQKTQP